MAEVELREVTPGTWRAVVAVAPSAEQAQHVAPVAYYLCLCHYGGVWRPLAVHAGGLVGFVMWGVDDSDASHWIGGLVIDAGRQRRGFGRAAMTALIARLAKRESARRLALSYAPSNTAARDLYSALGFRETGEVEDDEVVARLTLATAP